MNRYFGVPYVINMNSNAQAPLTKTLAGILPRSRRVVNWNRIVRITWTPWIEAEQILKVVFVDYSETLDPDLT